MKTKYNLALCPSFLKGNLPIAIQTVMRPHVIGGSVNISTRLKDTLIVSMKGDRGTWTRKGQGRITLLAEI